MGCVFCCAREAYAQAVHYDFEIVAPEPYRTLIGNNIDLARWRDNPLLDEPQLQRLAEKTPEQIRHVLETEGYYAPRIESSLTKSEGVWRARYVVELGDAVLVRKTQIEFSGAIAQASGEPSPATLRSAWPLRDGSRFRHAEWEQAKIGLLRDLTAKRYLGAHLKASHAEVDPPAHRADLFVDVDSGPIVKL